ncbi:MAG: PorT family protein [Bdellovibrionaceae bacterium]|nr:PorT family protein [Pseudobdellovibrionaceae bacterium]
MRSFLIIFFLMTGTYAQAQEVPAVTPATPEAATAPATPVVAAQPEQSLGVFAGVSYTDLNTDGSETIDATLGYRIGIMSVAGLTEKIALRYGLGYSNREFKSSTAGIETTFKFNYADIPIAVQYKFSDMLSMYAGTIVAVNVNNKTDTAGTEDKVELLKNLYPMAQLGAVLNFKQKFGLDIYYETGFSGIIRRAPNANYSNFGVNFIYWL